MQQQWAHYSFRAACSKASVKKRPRMVRSLVAWPFRQVRVHAARLSGLMLTFAQAAYL